MKHIIDFVRRIFYGGKTRLLPYEAQIINAIISRCADESRDILVEQLKQYSFLQRIPDARFLVFFFDGGRPGGQPNVLLSNKGELCRFASVASMDGENYCTLVTTRGRLLSLEFTAFPEGLIWDWETICFPAKKNIKNIRKIVDEEEHSENEQ